MSRSFYLSRRGKIWYIRLKNPQTGKLLSAKSSGTDDKNKAEYIAHKWLFEGIPDGKTRDPRSAAQVFNFDEILQTLKSCQLTTTDAKRITDFLKSQGLIRSANITGTGEFQTLAAFLLSFWDYDQSPYVKEKLAHGHSIGRRRCQDATIHVNRYWKPYFIDKALEDVSKADIKGFSLYLAEEKKLAAKTINNVMGAGTVALSWAFKNEIIDQDPGRGLMKFSGVQKRRGILSDKEVENLFSSDVWGSNEGARLGNLLSSQTGLRAGEVVALQIQDIGKDRLFIRHSYSWVDGLKTPKNGEEREVPILEEMRENLFTLARKNPHGAGPGSFVFWTIRNTDKPMRTETLRVKLIHALVELNLSKIDQKKPEKVKEVKQELVSRGITFHSWRHYYARKMTDVLAERTAKLTGHKTPEMLQHYANHRNEADFQKAAEATAQVFGKVHKIDDADKAM